MSDSPPGDFALNLNRRHYRVEAALYACAIAVFAVPPFGVLALRPVSIVTVPALAVLVAGFVSVLQILSLRDPVLLIDARGIFDKRVTREVLPWEKVRGIQIPPVFWPCVRFDVGNRRLAGIALSPWTYFGVFRHSLLRWDDVVINPQGLNKDEGKSHAMLAADIAACAEALRARHGRASAAKV